MLEQFTNAVGIVTPLVVGLLLFLFARSVPVMGGLIATLDKVAKTVDGLQFQMSEQAKLTSAIAKRDLPPPPLPVAAAATSNEMQPLFGTVGKTLGIDAGIDAVKAWALTRLDALKTEVVQALQNITTGFSEIKRRLESLENKTAIAQAAATTASAAARVAEDALAKAVDHGTAINALRADLATAKQQLGAAIDALASRQPTVVNNNALADTQLRSIVEAVQPR